MHGRQRCLGLLAVGAVPGGLPGRGPALGWRAQEERGVWRAEGPRPTCRGPRAGDGVLQRGTWFQPEDSRRRSDLCRQRQKRAPGRQRSREKRTDRSGRRGGLQTLQTLLAPAPCRLSCVLTALKHRVPALQKFLSAWKETFHQFSSVQSLSRVRRFATPWTAAHQASLSINSWSLPKLISMESLMPSSHLILCRPLLLAPSVFPSIRVFSNESALCIRWPKVEFQLQHQSIQ